LKVDNADHTPWRIPPPGGPSMTVQSATCAPSPLAGIGLATLGYALFAIQDVLVKLLVEDFSVPQVLFARSIVVVGVASTIGGPGTLGMLAGSRHKRPLLGRAGLILLAWLSYYSAARHLGLAELTTLYFASRSCRCSSGLPASWRVVLPFCGLKDAGRARMRRDAGCHRR